MTAHRFSFNTAFVWFVFGRYLIVVYPCRVLMARYVLAGPQPCELVDVKVDFTYKYNTLTRSGSFFRATQSLKLVISTAPLILCNILYLYHCNLCNNRIHGVLLLYLTASGIYAAFFNYLLYHVCARFGLRLHI